MAMLGFEPTTVQSTANSLSPSSIYSWSISHILEHVLETSVWAELAIRKKKVDLSFSEQLLRVVF